MKQRKKRAQSGFCLNKKGVLFQDEELLEHIRKKL